MNSPDDRFRCLECGHRGPAIWIEVDDWHPYGEGTVKETTYQDPSCEDCGSPHLVLINEE